MIDLNGFVLIVSQTQLADHWYICAYIFDDLTVKLTLMLKWFWKC